MWWFGDQVFFHFLVLPSPKISESSALKRERYGVCDTLVLWKPKSGCDIAHLCSCGTTRNHFYVGIKTFFPSQQPSSRSNFILCKETHILMDNYPTLPKVIIPPEKHENRTHFIQKKRVLTGSFTNLLTFHCLKLPLKVLR